MGPAALRALGKGPRVGGAARARPGHGQGTAPTQTRQGGKGHKPSTRLLRPAPARSTARAVKSRARAGKSFSTGEGG